MSKAGKARLQNLPLTVNRDTQTVFQKSIEEGTHVKLLVELCEGTDLRFEGLVVLAFDLKLGLQFFDK